MNRSILADAGQTPEIAGGNGSKRWVRPSFSKLVAGSAEVGGDTLIDGGDTLS